jgi:hypothetical protein
MPLILLTEKLPLDYCMFESNSRCQYLIRCPPYRPEKVSKSIEKHLKVSKKYRTVKYRQDYEIVQPWR